MTPQAHGPKQHESAANRALHPQARTAATREKILDSALSVFCSRGFTKGSLLEIAERAGMTHAGVLHHFGSKDQLLMAVLERRDAEDNQLPEGQAPRSAAEFLTHLAEMAEVNSSRAGIVQTYAVLSAESVTADHPAQDYFRERFGTLRARVADSLREFSPEDTPEEELQQAAAAVIAAMDGLQVQWLLSPEQVNMPAALDAVIDGLVAWLNRRATPLTGHGDLP